jgi:hypothetical protein
VDLVKTSGLENDLMMSGHNVTVFVPSNDAIDDFRHDMEEVHFIHEKYHYNLLTILANVIFL